MLIELATPPRTDPAPPASSSLAWVDVDLGVIRDNTRLLASTADPADLMAVVKADAFGHGLVPVAKACLTGGARWLGVARIEEALALAAAGITAPKLAWLFDAALVEDAVRAEVHLSVSALDELAAVVAAGQRLGLCPRVHLELDTGMRRSGCSAEAWVGLVAAAAQAERRHDVHVAGIWTHFSHADETDPAEIRAQLWHLRLGLRAAYLVGLTPDLVHCANSAATMRAAATRLDLVRCGAGLYGITSAATAHCLPLRAALTWRSRLAQVRAVRAGDGVGYGHDWRAPRDGYVGLVPVGFADGIPRRLGAEASVLVDDRRAPLVGRVSMDQIVVDLGAHPVRPGAAVTLIGDGSDAAPTVDEWARWAGTNAHEIYTGIGARIPRRYRGGEGAAR